MAELSNKSKVIEQAISQIEKQFGRGSIMKMGVDRVVDVPSISTGSLALDLALGVGGLPRGRVIEIYGPESSGKCFSENNYLFTIPLPGFSKEEVRVSLISNNLNITAKKPSNENEKKEEDQIDDINCGIYFTKNLLNFLWNKDVNLDISLPSDLDRENIISKMNNGLLKIKIEKLPPKKLDITTGDHLN